jgi:hypothetical protein
MSPPLQWPRRCEVCLVLGDEVAGNDDAAGSTIHPILGDVSQLSAGFAGPTTSSGKSTSRLKELGESLGRNGRRLSNLLASTGASREAPGCRRRGGPVFLFQEELALLVNRSFGRRRRHVCHYEDGVGMHFQHIQDSRRALAGRWMWVWMWM